MPLSPLPEIVLECPYCGESFASRIDTDGQDSAYVEDCPVCCAPIEIRVAWNGAEEPTVTAHRDDD